MRHSLLGIDARGVVWVIGARVWRTPIFPPLEVVRCLMPPPYQPIFAAVSWLPPRALRPFRVRKAHKSKLSEILPAVFLQAEYQSCHPTNSVKLLLSC